MILIFLVGFSVRLALMLAFQTYSFPAVRNHYFFGFETGSIAGSIATGEGFSSPFGLPSGPTAWIAPIYPSLVALVFRIFGLFSDASAIAILTINSLASAFTAVFIYLIARETFDESSGKWAAWIWAVVPFFARWPVTWVWETAFAALFLSALFWVTMRLDAHSTKAWFGLGVLWGATALTSPSTLAFLPISIAYPIIRHRNEKVRLHLPLIATATIILIVSPWMIRNYAVFGKPVFIRSNFWFEASLSNYHNSTSEAWSGMHPSLNQRQFERYKALGETAFIEDAKLRTQVFIRNHPFEFSGLVAKRILSFWSGDELRYESRDDPFKPWMVLLTSILAFGGLTLAIARRKQWGLYAGLLALFPIPYYLTYTNPRYRHPIEPVMVVLTGFLIHSVFIRTRTRREKNDDSVVARGTAIAR